MTGLPGKRLLPILVLSTIFTLIFSGLTVAASGKSGTVTGISGQVSVKAIGEYNWKPAKVGLDIHTGDSIKTDKNSWVEITMADDSIITLGGGSQLKINEYAYNPKEKIRVSKVRLFLGKVRCLVNDVFGYKKKTFEVSTKTAVAGARGTEFMVWLDDGETTKAAAFKNDIWMAPADKPFQKTTIPEGFFLELEKGKSAGQPQKMTGGQIDRFRRGMPGNHKGDKPGTAPGPAKSPPGDNQPTDTEKDPKAISGGKDGGKGPGGGGRGGGGGGGGGGGRP